nr:MAG TPA: hypothetical protein [Caudoviricetes sp.]
MLLYRIKVINVLLKQMNVINLVKLFFLQNIMVNFTLN